MPPSPHCRERASARDRMGMVGLCTGVGLLRANGAKEFLMSAMLAMAYWTSDRERRIGKNSPKESDQDPGLPGSVGDALSTASISRTLEFRITAQNHPWKLNSRPLWILGDRIDLYCILNCKKWVNYRFGHGRWTLPSHYPSSVVRIYQTYTNMHQLTGQCRRCQRGWRKKRNRYALTVRKSANKYFPHFYIIRGVPLFSAQGSTKWPPVFSPETRRISGINAINGRIWLMFWQNEDAFCQSLI